MLYPVIMVMAVWRVIKLRIHPDAVLVFIYYDHESDADTAICSPGVLSKCKTSLVNQDGLFSWADRGRWEAAGSEDSQTVRERNWFRIGFEPIFVDFTKPGTWYILISLVQVGVQHTAGEISLFTVTR